MQVYAGTQLPSLRRQLSGPGKAKKTAIAI